MHLIYFDIGDTLGSAVVTPDGVLSRVHVFPGVTEVLRRLQTRGCVLGLLSNTGNNTSAQVDEALGRSGLLEFFDPRFRLYSSVVGITKQRKEMFELAFGRAVSALGECPDVYFVGENRSERAFALETGFRVAPHPSLIESVLAGESLSFVRVNGTSGVSHLMESVERLGVVGLGADPTHPDGVIGVVSPTSEAALRAAGMTVDHCYEAANPSVDDLFFVRHDGEESHEPRRCLASCASGELLAVDAEQQLADRHDHARHGHLKHLGPSVPSRRVRFVDTALDSESAAELSEYERGVLAGMIDEQSLSEIIGRIIGEEDGIGRIRHSFSPDMWRLVTRLASDLEETSDGRIRTSLNEFEYATGETLADGSRVTIRLWNVVGELKGETDDLVLVTAHLDSTSKSSFGSTYAPRKHPSPGADDDASGMAAVLRIARVFSALFSEKRPRRTVRFVLFNAEEQGLLGSAAYARLLVAQNASVAGVFQMDMIGYNGLAPNTFETHAGTSGSLPVQNPALEKAALGLAEMIRRMSVHLADHDLSILEPAQVYRSPDGAAGRSDHASFLDAGFPACVTSEDFFADPGQPADPNPNYHRVGDTVVDLPFATSIARVVGAAALRLTQPQPLECEEYEAPECAALAAHPEGRCIVFAGGNRFCADSLARITPEQIERIALSLPVAGEDLSNEDRALAELLIGPFSEIEATLSFSNALDRLFAVIREAHYAAADTLTRRVEDSLASVESSFAARVFSTSSFDVHYQTDGDAAVAPETGDVEIREPGTDRLIATLADNGHPTYVRRLAFWLERALTIYTSGPYSLDDPTVNRRLQAHIIATRFGGANPSGFFVGNSLPEAILVAVTVHELFHMLQYSYDGAGPWRGALFEGGATFAEDGLADGMNRYLYETGSGFNGPGLFDNPNQSLDASASRYKTALFWRYLAERQVSSSDSVPGAGAGAYRRVLEECRSNGFNLASVRQAVASGPRGVSLDRFEHAEDGRFLITDETLWGNFSLALIVRDLDPATTDRRFRFDEDGENIFFDDALRQVPGTNPPSQQHAGRVKRRKMRIATGSSRAQERVLRFASSYHEIELAGDSTSVQLKIRSSEPLFQPIVQVVAVSDGALVDVYRSRSANFTRVLSRLRAAAIIDRLFVVVSGTEQPGLYQLLAAPTEDTADLFVTNWNCDAGLHYPWNPQDRPWNAMSPDLWATAVSAQLFEINLRVRNQGGAPSAPVTVVVEYRAETAEDWSPIAKPDGDLETFAFDAIEGHGESVVSGSWLPSQRSASGRYLLRASIVDGSPTGISALSSFTVDST